MAEVLIDTEDSEDIVEFLEMTMHMIFSTAGALVVVTV